MKRFEIPERQVDRVFFTALSAGDLNADGADDLLTTSMALPSADETGRASTLR